MCGILHHIAKPDARPLLAAEQRQSGPVGIALAVIVMLIIALMLALIILLAVVTMVIGVIVIVTLAVVVDRTITGPGLTII